MCVVCNLLVNNRKFTMTPALQNDASTNAMMNYVFIPSRQAQENDNAQDGHPGGIVNNASDEHPGGIVNNASDEHQGGIVNNASDGMDLEQLKEGFWGAVGILYSLVNWLYGLLRRRQTWSVLTALGLLSLAFFVICPTWEPPPETVETAPVVTTSTALIPFVPLKPDKVILEPVEGMWRVIHTRVSYLKGWEACLESMKSQKPQDKRHLAIQNQQGIELEREEFIKSFQQYVVDCVQKQMNKIHAYSNSLLTIDQIENNIGRMELNVQGAIRVTNKLERFIPYMNRGDFWNSVLDHASAIVLGAWSVLFISMLILHIYKGHTGAAIFCMVLFVAPLTWSVSRWCLSRIISPDGIKYIDLVLPTPKTLLGIDLVNRVEDSLLPDLAKILDTSLMKGFVDSCENGASAILILKMATTENEIVHGYAHTPKSCDCGESPSNWISTLDEQLKYGIVSEVDSPETPKIPLSYHLDSVYGEHNARCDDAMKFGCTFRRARVLETHAEVIGRLCNATIKLMAFEGVRIHLKPDSDENRINKERYNTTQFLTDTWWSCKKIQEALLLKSAMPPENVNSSFVILANAIRDGNIHLNHDERRKMAATKRQDWARDTFRSSCEKGGEDATARYFTERFPQLEPAKTDVPTLNAMTASP